MHGCTGRTSFYAYYGVSFSLSSAKDTDGQPGAEIIVLWAGDLGANGINVIHDSTGTTNTYTLNTTFTIGGVRDYDGIAGAEICYSWFSGNTRYSLIVDRLRIIVATTGC